MPDTLGFIGGGNMAEAIVKAAIDSRVMRAGQMIVSDPAAARREMFEKLGVAVTEDNAAVLRESEAIVLAIKPQMLPTIAPLLAEQFTDEQLLISILAGISTAKLEAAIGRPARIVRVMPNTPMMLGVGMAGVAPGRHAKTQDAGWAMKLFTGGNSRAIQVVESRIDAITAVSGSGPAYLFYLAEAMHEAAARLGLAEHADVLVRQTLLGAAMLLDRSEDPAAALRQKVTSPGGTTQAAIGVLDEKSVKSAVIEAIEAAEKRSRELGA